MWGGFIDKKDPVAATPGRNKGLKDSVYTDGFWDTFSMLKKYCRKDCLFLFTGHYVGRKTYLMQAFVKINGGRFIREASGTGIGFEKDYYESLPEKSMFDWIRPEVYFVGTRHNIRVPSKYALQHWNIRYTSSMNYIKWLNQTDFQDDKLPNKFAVFVDENLPYHVEAMTAGIKWVQDDKAYFSQLNCLFREIKKQTGLDTVVALHPSSWKNKEFGKEYDYRAAASYLGQTVYLIHKSEFAILNACTSIDFVVLENKPLLLYTSEDIKGFDGKKKFADLYSKELGAPQLSIDNPSEVINFQKYIFHNEEKYEAFKRDRIVAPECEGNR